MCRFQGSQSDSFGAMPEPSGFPVAQMVKNLPSMQETHVQSPGREDALEKGITTHNPLSRQVLA